MSDPNVRTDSYRFATAPALSDDNRTADGMAKSRRIPGIKSRSADLDELKQEVYTDHHKIPLQDLYYRFGTHPEFGLTHAKAKENLERDGPNAFYSPPRVPESVRFLKHLFGGFSLLLWAATLLCFISYSVHASTVEKAPLDNFILGLIMTVLIIVLGIFSYFQERKSLRIMDTLHKDAPQFATVIRQGERLQIPFQEIVLGDLVTLRVGSVIPADLRLIEAATLKVDNSSLTGEVEPQSRGIEMTHDSPLETQNLAFFSTMVAEGCGRGVVIACGHNTVMGKIALLSDELDKIETPLTREIQNFTSIVISVSFTISIGLFIIALTLGYHWVDAVVLLVGVLLACIPASLLTTVTLSLSFSAKKLAAKNCLVKNLESIEALGSTTVICADKTGTLTQNKLTLSHLWLDKHIIEMNPRDEQSDITRRTGFKELARALILSSRAQFNESEISMLQFMEGSLKEARVHYSQVLTTPTDTTHTYELSSHKSEKICDLPYIVVLKGAPEVVFNHCTTAFINGNEVPIDYEIRTAFHNACMELGGRGERMIGVCDLKLTEQKYYSILKDMQLFLPIYGLRFLGMISMIDPPRFSVPDAIIKCRSAEIKVVMVTGDHQTTATSVAKAVGIISATSETVEDISRRRHIPISEVDPREAEAAVIHGNDLRDLSVEQVCELVNNHREIVFARTTPQQKVIIVESFQRLGEIVAMTGDGINDSPALKKADISIAMGSGSDVSKQVADIILLDDNFATVVTAIEEGRILFDNLQKSITYSLTSNIPEVFPFLAFLIFDIPLPIGIITILCIDLGTDFLPAISLFNEKPEYDVMKISYRRHSYNYKLFDEEVFAKAFGQIGVIQAAAGFFAYFVVMAQNGFLPLYLLGLRKDWHSIAINDLRDSFGQEWTYHSRMALQRTCHTSVFVAIVLVQLANVVICKTRRKSIFQQGMDNAPLNFSLVFETLLAIILVYSYGVFHVMMSPLKFNWWLPAIPFVIYILVFDEVRKLSRRNFKIFV